MTTLDTSDKDKAEITLLDNLHTFRRQHGPVAYLALLEQHGVRSWAALPATAHGVVLAQCKAGTRGLRIEATATDVEDAERDSSTIQSRLNDLAAKVYGNGGLTKRDGSRKVSEVETLIRSGDSLKEGLDMAARAVHLRNRSQQK